MKPEYIIAFYMIICVLMTLFNFVFLFSEKFKTRRLKALSAKMSKRLAHEIDSNADFPTKEHRKKLLKSLRSLSGLEAFDYVMDEMLASKEVQAERYLRGIASVFRRLSICDQFKSPLEKAYFAYIVRKWYRRKTDSFFIKIGLMTDAVAETMMAYMLEESFYVRENALEALASMGTAHELASSVAAVQGGVNEEQSFNQRVITECMLAFKGDYHDLADELRRATKNKVSDQTAVGILNFMRMTGTGEPSEILEALRDEDCSLEYRIAAARYFMSNPYAEAAEVLRRYAQTQDASLWELTVACVSALAAYPGDDTVDVLISCLGSRVWYVRKNAADSLLKLGVTQEELKSVLEGDDEFARDMIQYYLEINGERVQA